MRHRSLASSLRSGGVLLVAIAVTALAARGVAGQAPAAAKPAQAKPAAKKWTVPRTPDGQPDLQGYWTNSTYVPLERPDKVTKAVYTEEEFAVVIKEAAAREAEQTEPGTVADVHYDFSQFGLDRSQSAFVKNDLRTSLILDPPNGKLPPVTAEGQKRAADRAAERRRLGATTDAVQNMPIGTRCLVMAGLGTADDERGLQRQLSDRPGRRIRDDSRRDDPRRPHHPARRPGGRAPGEHAPVDRRFARPLGGRYARHRDDESERQESIQRGEREHARHRTHLARWTRDHLSYRFTVTDPHTWATPWTAEAPMTKSIGPIFEHACHEGNYGVTNTLAGARLEDKKAAEAAAKKTSN